MAIIIQVILGGLVIGGVYCLIGYGFVLCWRVAKVLNLGQASSGVFGAFICLYLVRFGVPLPLSFICGILVAGVLGLITERLIINPLRRSKIIGWLIGGLAVEIVLRQSLTYWWGSDWFKFPSLLGQERTITIGGAATSADRLLLIFAAFFIVYLVEVISDKTVWGKAMRATAHDEPAAGLMGINTTLVVMAVFAMSAAFCAISVMLQAPFTNLSCVMGFELVVKGFAVAIIGGLDSRRGAIIAATVIGLLEAAGSIIAPAGYRDVFTFSMLILVLISRPQGLFGVLQLREV
jgi:branched-chain amino acid transport system permease protein